MALRKLVKSANSNKIFDLLIDRYEDKYLLRFSKPRKGNQDNTPDIAELRKFWNYLHNFDMNAIRPLSKMSLSSFHGAEIRRLFSDDVSRYGGMTLAKTLMAVGEYRSKNASNPYVREVARTELGREDEPLSLAICSRSDKFIVKDNVLWTDGGSVSVRWGACAVF